MLTSDWQEVAKHTTFCCFLYVTESRDGAKWFWRWIDQHGALTHAGSAPTREEAINQGCDAWKNSEPVRRY